MHNGLYNSGNPPRPDTYTGCDRDYLLEQLPKSERDLREVEQDRRTTTGNIERKQYLDSKIAFISEEISLIRMELNRR
jgi:hypothetical protein